MTSVQSTDLCQYNYAKIQSTVVVCILEGHGCGHTPYAQLIKGEVIVIKIVIKLGVEQNFASWQK